MIRAFLLLLLLSSSALCAEILTYRESLDRISLTHGVIDLIAGTEKDYTLRRPIALSVAHDQLMFFDQFTSQLVRFDLTKRTIYLVSGFRSVISADITEIELTENGNFYLIDTYDSSVRFFSKNGELLRTINETNSMVSPVAIEIFPHNDDILVADGPGSHIVRFSNIGWSLGAFGERGDEAGQLLDLVDLAVSGDRIYAVSRVNPYVVIYDDKSEVVHTFLRKEVGFPSAIAVDGWGRIYISDLFDDTIKIYESGRLIETVGATGGGESQFRGISDLEIEGDKLFAADSDNGRIQIFTISR